MKLEKFQDLILLLVKLQYHQFQEDMLRSKNFYLNIIYVKMTFTFKERHIYPRNYTKNLQRGDTHTNIRFSLS